MKHPLSRLLLPAVAFLLLPSLLGAQSDVTAFVHVNVLPMDRERVLEDHTVLIWDGQIQEVAPSYRVELPAGARVVEGEGRFLLPGLADLHVTLPSAGAGRQEAEDFMLLLLANNILAVRGMAGEPYRQVKGEISVVARRVK